MTENSPVTIELNEKVINRLEKKIIIEENRNLRTKKKSDAEMVSTIKKMIEEEDQCFLNQ